MIYSLVSAIGTALALPWALIHGKRRGTSPQQVWSRLRAPQGLQPCDVWLHGVSAGEIRALEPLLRHLQTVHPQWRITLSTGTSTGLQEAWRLAPTAQAFILPFDLPWTMRRLAGQLQPRWLVLSEGDLWMGMLRAVKRIGCPITVVGAKLSDRSANRWRWVPTLARRLYGLVDLFCAQSEEMAGRLRRWAGDPEKVVSVGSFKEQRALHRMSDEERREYQRLLGLDPQRPVLLLGSTHAGEEMRLMASAEPLLHQGWQIILCPRHPARWPDVQAALAGMQRAASKVLTAQEGCQCSPGHAQIVGVAKFGVLTDLMQLSTVVVLGGSFEPGVGGHNILEATQLGKPVLWGPYMETQRALVARVVELEGGEQIEAEDLERACLRWSQVTLSPLAEPAEGALQATLAAVEQTLGPLGSLVSR